MTPQPAHLIVRRADGRPDLTVSLCPEHAASVVALLADLARESPADPLIVMPLSHLRRTEEFVYHRARLARH